MEKNDISSVNSVGNSTASVIIQGCSCNNITVNYGGIFLDEMERELIYIFRFFSMREKVNFLMYAYSVEDRLKAVADDGKEE